MVEIEIFSDVVCPWCFIGKRRLDAVLASQAGEGVQVRWRPYQLYAQMPIHGVDRADYLERRFGADAAKARIPRRIEEEALGEGIQMRYELIRRMPNTLAAHRLLEWSYVHGVQHALAEALFVAYFCAGRDVGDIDTLADVAAEVGLERTSADDYLRSEAGAREVQAQLDRALEVGITGVPGYLFAGGFLLPGAQTSDTMRQVLARVQDKLAERSTTS